MFTNCHILGYFYYICAQNAQCWTRITKSDMEIQRYNRLKAAIERVQSEACFNFTELEQARPQVKIVLAEKERTGMWLSEQMGHNFFDKRVQSRTRSSYAERRKSRTQFNISTVSRWMTNKVQPSVEPLGFAAYQSKNSTRLHDTLMRI